MCILIWKLFIHKLFPIESVPPYLERLNPAKPELEASSISGVTIRSIMSVNTVKVGTTMKSMNPGDSDIRELDVHTYSLSLFIFQGV